MYPTNTTGDMSAVPMTGLAAAIILGSLAVVGAGMAVYIRWAMRQTRSGQASRAHRRELRMVHAEFNEIVRDLLR